MSHNNTMQTYTPDAEFYKDIYIVEKTETQEGWSEITPDEGWFLGYQHELESFYRSVVTAGRIESNSRLASDTIATIYAAYVSAERSGAEVEVVNL
jgi:hypothetical protein